MGSHSTWLHSAIWLAPQNLRGNGQQKIHGNATRPLSRFFWAGPGHEARCLTCEFANLLPCVILIAAEDWKKNQCICCCVDCSNRLHEGKSHHEILPVVSAVFVMWGVKPLNRWSLFWTVAQNWLGCGTNWLGCSADSGVEACKVSWEFFLCALLGVSQNDHL